MIRIITETAKPDGTIMAVGGVDPSGKPWNPCSREDAVRDTNHYFVLRPPREDEETPIFEHEPIPEQALIPVVRVHGPTCTYLRSVADGTHLDNLAALPELDWPIH